MRTMLLILTIIAASLGSPAVAWGLFGCGCDRPVPSPATGPVTGPVTGPMTGPVADCCQLTQPDPSASLGNESFQSGACGSHTDLPCGCGCQARSTPEHQPRPEPSLPRGDISPEIMITPAAPVRLAGWVACQAPRHACAADDVPRRDDRPWASWVGVRTT